MLAHDDLDTSVSLVPRKEESKRVTKDSQGKRPVIGAIKYAREKGLSQ